MIVAFFFFPTSDHQRPTSFFFEKVVARLKAISYLDVHLALGIALARS
jgi:hypothetical protein